MRRLAIAVALLTVWAAFGFGVNRFLESRKSNLAATRSTVAPTEEKPAVTLPGTIYVSQSGKLYRLAAGAFTEIKLPTSSGAWTQPAAAPGGNLLAVARAANSSDVFLVDPRAHTIVRKLTTNATTTRRVELNAWGFFPHVAADGTTVIFNYDGPKTGQSYQVDLAVWSGPIDGKLATRRWTTPNGYTGGDVAPMPLPGGGVVYAEYQIDNGKVLSRVATVARPGANPVYITAAADDCSAPAVSPDGSQLAVVCTSDSQAARLVLIPLVKGVPGAPTVLVDSCLCASPAWSPDGGGLLYLAPADATGHFQLWWLDKASAAKRAAPTQVTSRLDLEATSPPAWVP
jgi:Tol biopolymer transport system component